MMSTSSSIIPWISWVVGTRYEGWHWPEHGENFQATGTSLCIGVCVSLKTNFCRCWAIILPLFAKGFVSPMHDGGLDSDHCGWGWLFFYE